MPTSGKRLEKQLPSKANFGAFLQINCSNFRLKLGEKPQGYQNRQRQYILRNLGRLTSRKNCFQRRSFTKYLRLTQVFM